MKNKTFQRSGIIILVDIITYINWLHTRINNIQYITEQINEQDETIKWSN